MQNLGKLQGRKNVESGQLQGICASGGRGAGKMAASSGRVHQMIAKRWGVEVEPNLWVSKKTNKVLYDGRTEK